jgi:hypothetical protein
MALDFNEPFDRVSVAASSTINSLTACTRLVWIYWDTFAANGAICGKGSAATRRLLTVSSSGNYVAGADRTTVAVFSTQALLTAFSPAITTGKWVCLALTVDLSVNASGKLYAGDLSTLVTEPSPYNFVAGTAAPAADDSGFSLHIGYDDETQTSPDAKIAIFGLWNRVLSLAELQAQQPYQSLVVPTGCVCFLNLDSTASNPLSQQPDLSGNGNHGTPAATTSVTHPALLSGGPPPTTGGAGDPLLTTRLQQPSRGGIYY